MNYLIDTHILIWHAENDPKLAPRFAAILNDSANNIVVSYASLWEIAIKQSLGKLSVSMSLSELEIHLKHNLFTLLNTSVEQLERLQKLPFYHNDPFDRLLIAQAQEEELTIITEDGNFKYYQVNLL
jgi:PIN domain nuclease of toxin-antitoxin system